MLTLESTAWVFFTFQMILNNFLKNLKKNLWKVFRRQIAWNGWLTQKKHMLPFFPDVKMIPAFFFSVSQVFLKEYPVILILIPEVGTEEMKLFALHISYSTKLWLIIPFPFGKDPDLHFFADPDRSKTCGSRSETLLLIFSSESQTEKKIKL